MSAEITWIGMKELMVALKRLPQELTELGSAIVQESAERAAAEVKAAYPVGPGDDDYEGGNLRKGVRVGQKRTGKYALGWTVRSTAPHAYMFETGTQVRYNISRNQQLLKKPAHRGFMPGSNIFVPIMVARRREMYEDLTALLEQSGLDVRR
jgi:hypothetical protein